MTNVDLGRATSHALTDVRTLLSRAETVLYYWRDDQPLVLRMGQFRPHDLDADETGHVGREVVISHPEIAEMRAAMEEVVRLLSPWRRTGRPKKA